MVAKKQRKFSPFNIYSFYIDTPDYLADPIMNDVCLQMDILDEKHVKTSAGKTYILVYVRYNKKYGDRYKRFLDVLRYNMLMYNNPGYVADCKELMESMKDDKVFGGNWS